MADTCLFECISCKDLVREGTYLLPCLHLTCLQCVGDIVADAEQKKKKPGCVECGEIFEQAKLTVFSASTTTTASAFCEIHPDKTVVSFCVHCNALECSECSGAEGEHSNLPFESGITTLQQACSRDMLELLQLLPKINNRAAEHTKSILELKQRKSLIQNQIAELQAETKAFQDQDPDQFADKIGNIATMIQQRESSMNNIQQQEKVENLQLDDLEMVKSLVLNAQQQIEALNIMNDNILLTRIRLQWLISRRVAELKSGLNEALNSVVFDVVHQSITVSNNGKTITKTEPDPNNGHGTCTVLPKIVGERTWRITIHKSFDGVSLLIGIINHPNQTLRPSLSHHSANVYGVGYSYVFKNGQKSFQEPFPRFGSGDIVLLTTNEEQHYMLIQNITREWTHQISLPPPFPTYLPHVNLRFQHDSVTIETIT